MIIIILTQVSKVYKKHLRNQPHVFNFFRILLVILHVRPGFGANDNYIQYDKYRIMRVKTFTVFVDFIYPPPPQTQMTFPVPIFLFEFKGVSRLKTLQ